MILIKFFQSPGCQVALVLLLNTLGPLNPTSPLQKNPWNLFSPRNIPSLCCARRPCGQQHSRPLPRQRAQAQALASPRAPSASSPPAVQHRPLLAGGSRHRQPQGPQTRAASLERPLGLSALTRGQPSPGQVRGGACGGAGALGLECECAAPAAAQRRRGRAAAADRPQHAGARVQGAAHREPCWPACPGVPLLSHSSSHFTPRPPHPAPHPTPPTHTYTYNPPLSFSTCSRPHGDAGALLHAHGRAVPAGHPGGGGPRRGRPQVCRWASAAGSLGRRRLRRLHRTLGDGTAGLAGWGLRRPWRRDVQPHAHACRAHANQAPKGSSPGPPLQAVHSA